MITLSHLTMRLAGGGHQITILDDLTLEIPDKQRVAIVGPSGSGKSTLLGLIAGLDRPTSGSIMLNGVEISTMRESALARYRRDHIGYIFQSFHLIPTLTALENVLVPLELAGMSTAQDRATELLRTVGLGDRLIIIPSNSREVSSSGWRWPEPSPVTHRFCWPMSRPATWIRPRDNP